MSQDISKSTLTQKIKKNLIFGSPPTPNPTFSN